MSEPGTPAAADEPVANEPVDATPRGTRPDASTELDAGIPVDRHDLDEDGVATADEAEPPRRHGLRGRTFHIRLPRTRRGIFALLLVVGAFAFAGIWTSVSLIHWTETADFCGRCHQMGPELAGRDRDGLDGPAAGAACGAARCRGGGGLDGRRAAEGEGGAPGRLTAFLTKS